MKRMFFCLAQFFIFYSGIVFPKSDLFPTKYITEVSTLDLQSSYHEFVALSKLSGLHNGIALLTYIKNEEDAMAPLEVGGDYGPVFLLAGSVPDVQFGWFALQSDILDLKINCCDLGAFLVMELTFYKPPEKSSLAYIAIPNQNELIFLLLPE